MKDPALMSNKEFGAMLREAFSVCRRPSTTELYGPKERMIRCKRCNAAFFQDAEK